MAFGQSHVLTVFSPESAARNAELPCYFVEWLFSEWKTVFDAKKMLLRFGTGGGSSHGRQKNTT
jgi:hypothetical protein